MMHQAMETTLHRKLLVLESDFKLRHSTVAKIKAEIREIAANILPDLVEKGTIKGQGDRTLVDILYHLDKVYRVTNLFPASILVHCTVTPPK